MGASGSRLERRWENTVSALDRRAANAIDNAVGRAARAVGVSYKVQGGELAHWEGGPLTVQLEGVSSARLVGDPPTAVLAACQRVVLQRPAPAAAAARVRRDALTMGRRMDSKQISAAVLVPRELCRGQPPDPEPGDGEGAAVWAPLGSDPQQVPPHYVCAARTRRGWEGGDIYACDLHIRRGWSAPADERAAMLALHSVCLRRQVPDDVVRVLVEYLQSPTVVLCVGPDWEAEYDGLSPLSLHFHDGAPYSVMLRLRRTG
eukprot:TRINITY_DN22674_c0_g1_i1.p1 TRINITY_DN22674_c0_g1~~TRINITY_DN22674_c0_g1_i1.p1  ORF type:complete len:286 (+),score=67.65 TRINITY_DN22674_c0_g1_i1:78-860(+)